MAENEKVNLDILPALSDNYIYLMHWDHKAVVVDPGEAAPVVEALQSYNLVLEAILITHHHYDHTDGNLTLKEQSSCEIVGPEDGRVPGLDRSIGEGECLELGPLSFRVIETPAHTNRHISFYEPRQGWLFPGDTLFLGGCGRLFEGTAEQMWHSLQKLMALPPETQVYCGHEYTLSNLRFAHSLEPDNTAISTRIGKVEALRAKGIPSMGATLAEEMATNPFLRIRDEGLVARLGFQGASEGEIFAHIRRLKDQF